MCDGALAFIPQESFGDGFTKRAVGLAAPGTCSVSSREVCGLKLVILRCRAIQLVDCRRLIVDRCRVNSHDASLAVHLVAGSQLQSCNALLIH
jgi:hypothetical protein